ncbi:hypothetical protein DAPPUDRAFT_233506 [Daphnia pulex]|uniref:Uncharacterized protein n=1 Tax=Daphnia pulex TaxID=6669 RepID=E9FU81_DAPPU|nr:hypothetical protein DAPPUDRAFT_233506 [Daphnia pulex]|eukprot:EFX89517.1 hypothetical protein DAPPUDRAFT_233506 [Daphnia pulex]
MPVFLVPVVSNNLTTWSLNLNAVLRAAMYFVYTLKHKFSLVPFTSCRIHFGLGGSSQYAPCEHATLDPLITTLDVPGSPHVLIRMTTKQPKIFVRVIQSLGVSIVEKLEYNPNTNLEA